MSNATPEPDRTRMMPSDAAEAVTTPLPGSGASTPPAAKPVAGAPAIPGVAIDSELGRGGMGVVYRGRQTYVDRAVAVKVLSAVARGDHASDYVQRFQREARILANLAHPHIVACYQAGVTPDGSPYLVMEFIDGPNLWQWIRQHGPLSEAQALRVVADIARALGHASDQGIIHRDVKPENILLATRAAGDAALPFTAKLVDLGLARPSRGASAAMQVTVPGMVMGTPATMAPEQFDDPENVDHRADIYGLGCVLYHALTGRPAFGGTSLVDIVAAKAAGPAPDPRRLAPGLSSRTVELARAMLAAKREDRPQTYPAVIDACERAAGAPAFAARGRSPFAILTAAALVVAAAWWWNARSAAARHADAAPTAAAAASATRDAASIPAAVSAATERPASAVPAATAPSAPAVAPAASPAAAAGDVAFAAPIPLLGAAFDARLAGWERGAGWAPEEEGGDGVSGIAGGEDPTTCTHPLAAMTLRLTGLVASGAADPAGRFHEAGLRLDLADGGSAVAKVLDLGAGTLHLMVLTTKPDGVVAARSSLSALHGDPLAGWRFTLTVRNRTLAVELGDQRANPLPLLAEPSSVSLFVKKGAVAFRDLAIAYPTP